LPAHAVPAHATGLVGRYNRINGRVVKGPEKNDRFALSRRNGGWAR
jgi:hypothetical protein